MKKIIALAVAAVLSLSMLAGCSTPPASTAKSVAPSKVESRLDKILASKKLVMATSPDYAPYEFIDPTKKGQEQYVGIDIAVAKYIADKLGVQLEIQAMDFGACQAAVSQGKVDISLSGYAYTEERAQNYEISEGYSTSVDGKQGIMVRSEDAAKLKTAADFAGKTVAAQNGSIQLTMAQKQLPGAKIELITNLNDALLMLQTKKVDAVAIAEKPAEMYMQNNKGVEMSAFWFEYKDEGSRALMTKGEKQLAAKVNEIIKEFKASGKYAEYQDTYTKLAKDLGIKME